MLFYLYVGQIEAPRRGCSRRKGGERARWVERWGARPPPAAALSSLFSEHSPNSVVRAAPPRPPRAHHAGSSHPTMGNVLCRHIDVVDGQLYGQVRGAGGRREREEEGDDRACF